MHRKKACFSQPRALTNSTAVTSCETFTSSWDHIEIPYCVDVQHGTGFVFTFVSLDVSEFVIFVGNKVEK
jgi:hypothetical protein